MNIKYRCIIFACLVFSFMQISSYFELQTIIESQIPCLIGCYVSKPDQIIFADNLDLKIDLNHKMNPFVLITSLYNETNEARMKEYIVCLEKNLLHKSIEKIHVVYDISKDDTHNKLLTYLKSKKIEISYSIGRPTFGYLFNLANTIYQHKRIIMSNADIFFNNTLYLLDSLDLYGKFLALTRWNVIADGTIEIFKQFDKNGVFRLNWSFQSQDTWIFQTPIKKFNFDDIQLGTFLCDGLIAYQAYQAKLHIFNPCYTIQCCHLHLSGIRNYERFSPPNALIMSIPWTTLDESPNKHENNFEKYHLKEEEYQYFKM